MSSKPDVKLFRPLDTLYWVLFCGIPTGLAIGAVLTPQDTPWVAWIILWAAVAGFWLVAVLYFIKRYRLLQMLKFTTKHGITVGWQDEAHAVDSNEFEVQVDELLAKMRPKFEVVEKALAGCLIMMMPPTWIYTTPDFVARKVAGVQDGMYIYVGWRQKLSESALKHELAHRVLQVFAGDPPEAEAHKIMTELGLL